MASDVHAHSRCSSSDSRRPGENVCHAPLSALTAALRRHARAIVQPLRHTAPDLPPCTAPPPRGAGLEMTYARRRAQAACRHHATCRMDPRALMHVGGEGRGNGAGEQRTLLSKRPSADEEDPQPALLHPQAVV